jgi:hypothetical protein
MKRNVAIVIIIIVPVLAVIVFLVRFPLSTTTKLPKIGGSNPTPSPTALQLQKILAQATPYCDNKNGWRVPPNMQEGTNGLLCTKSGLQLEQNSSSASHFAELDLDSVNGQPYNQANFMETVSVAFTQDDIFTYGCLLIQTPAGRPGGYILCVNDRGSWQLQDATNILHPVAHGTINTKLGQKIALSMTVQSGSLTCSINGQTEPYITEVTNDIALDGQTGLIVEANGAIQSTPVLYTGFGFYFINN